MKKLKIAVPWAAAVLIMVWIFTFSSQHAEQSSQTSGVFSEFFARLFHGDYDDLPPDKQLEIINSWQFVIRKTAHFSVYAALGACVLLGCMDLRYRKFISPSICLAYSVSDEIHQYFVPGRSCELRDVCIDFAGSLTGMLAVMLVLYILKKWRKSK